MTKTGASVTEWSKVLRSGRSVFARVGSSPTACIFTILFLTSTYLGDCIFQRVEFF